jgi:RES domain-containing protein
VADLDGGSDPPLASIVWRPAHRLIASRYPPIDLFERVADPADWEALYALESLTNPRLRDEAGDIALVPREERVSGPGASILMAPFTHLNPNGSRFADATFGALYAAESVATAIAETRHHRERFLAATREPATAVELREYRIDVQADLHDLRGSTEQARFAAVYDRDNYAASQALGRRLRAAGSDGLCYRSVRREGGECVAVFTPRRLSNVRQGSHFRYQWNGARIDAVYELRLTDPE